MEPPAQTDDRQGSRRSARDLSLVDWLYLAVALKELALARLRFSRQHAGAIVAELKGRNAHAMATASHDVVPESVVRLSRAIGAAAERVPWRADCLLRVMAADRWMRRLGYAPRFELGVEKSEAGGLKAHAWLHLAGYTVTGGDVKGYTMLISQGDVRP